ncbi:MAG: chemotaxis protein CheW [Magnetospirillum sp.]|nr:chemotaxis protein CheW [Magnetospirillum sp.]
MPVIAAIAPAEKFVTLGVGREVFAVGVDVVREILDLQPMAALPNAPPFLMGIIDVRGEAVPVISLRLKLGLPAEASTDQTRIVVTEIPVGDRVLVLGLVADRVFEVTELDESAVEAPPEIGIRWRSDYIRAVARRSGVFVIVFDLARLFAGEDAALLSSETEP